MKTPALHLLLTFDGIHDVIKAEKLLLERGLACDLVPTPRHLSADCGMSIECRAADRPQLQELWTSGVLRWRVLHDPGE